MPKTDLAAERGFVPVDQVTDQRQRRLLEWMAEDVGHDVAQCLVHSSRKPYTHPATLVTFRSKGDDLWAITACHRHAGEPAGLIRTLLADEQSLQERER